MFVAQGDGGQVGRFHARIVRGFKTHRAGVLCQDSLADTQAF
jgi:hypothetical protein